MVGEWSFIFIRKRVNQSPLMEIKNGEFPESKNCFKVIVLSQNGTLLKSMRNDFIFNAIFRNELGFTGRSLC